MKIFLKSLFKGLFCLLIIVPVLAAMETSPVKFQLLSGGSQNNATTAGLILTIPKEWHVYAPTPKGSNAAGFEPVFTWNGSQNLKGAKILWPKAIETTIQDQLSYVYEGKVFIPIQLTPIKTNEPITFNLKMSLLACSSICLPIDESLSVTIKPNEPANSLFTTALKNENSSKDGGILFLLLIAFLGGFILNFMPCVLPVLSLKVMSLIKQSKKNHIKQAKHGFFITGLGIIASFLILALVTIFLKESGEAFGWGIHFQNPHFLLFVFLVLIAFAASLLGIFEIDLPSELGNWLISHEGKGRIKDFLSGVFATLLATPCSAPFVGTALSFALGRRTEEIIAVFFFLGLGFASPYILVASLPQRFIYLPKPGKWMLWIQTILGIILAATALWIGWILSFHLPLWALIVSTVVALAALSLFWIKHHKSPTLRAWAFALPLFIIAWSLSWIALETKEPKISDVKNSSPILELWKPFAPETIDSFVKNGKIVFVDATAEWCVTCAVNKSLVLNDPQIASILADHTVVPMKADWTKQDSKITDFIQSYERFGIPFNIIFGPNKPEGIVLPEILSVSGVQKAFEEAGYKKAN